MTVLEPLKTLTQRVADGVLLAVPPEYSFVPMTLIRALIQRPVKDLHVLAVPIGGMAIDMLVGAGCVKTLEAAAVSLGEAGPAPRFTAACEDGTIAMRDSTCPAIHTALQASEKGVDFMPLGGLVGSDLVDNRADWKVVDDPLGQGGGPVVLLPAIKPDVTVFHSPRADTEGNVWIGRRRELVTMAHAAAATLVTVEAVEDRDFLDDEATAAGTLSGLYVTAIAVAEGGARPLGLTGHYERDRTISAPMPRKLKPGTASSVTWTGKSSPRRGTRPKPRRGPDHEQGRNSVLKNIPQNVPGRTRHHARGIHHLRHGAAA